MIIIFRFVKKFSSYWNLGFTKIIVNFNTFIYLHHITTAIDVEKTTSISVEELEYLFQHERIDSLLVRIIDGFDAHLS